MMCLIEVHKWCVLSKHTFGMSFWSTQLVCLTKGHNRRVIEAQKWCDLLKHTNGVPYWSTQMVCLT